jgi:hypothetical protein
VTVEEIIELKQKINQLTKGMEDRILFDPDTGRAMMLVEAGKMDKAFDLEKAIPHVPRQPGATDDQIEDLLALTNEVNSGMRKYIDEFGKLSPELYLH